DDLARGISAAANLVAALQRIDHARGKALRARGATIGELGERVGAHGEPDARRKVHSMWIAVEDRSARTNHRLCGASRLPGHDEPAGEQHQAGFPIACRYLPSIAGAQTPDREADELPTSRLGRHA